MSSINLPLILTLAVLITGAIWLIDLLFLARPRKQKVVAVEEQFQHLTIADEHKKLAYEEAKSAASREPLLVEYAKSFFPVLFIVFFLRSFLVEPFQIPSGSMIPTLQVGDFILVNKFAYGLRVPVLNKTFIPVDKPKRGDVMVFFPPHQPKTYFIKRVIGLPGDKIRYTNNVLYLNGVEIKQEFVKKGYPEWGSPCMSMRQQMTLVNEDLLGVVHKMQKCDQPSSLGIDGSWEVPEGHYFMMGDNRDNSGDSRVWGTVSEDAIVGKAFAVWMHWEQLLSVPSFSNVGVVK
ncbi:MAG: signal peptidase I [Gammaproteobacteria bacterium]|nr:MAG: signal peptidase I [Gammaproteobacteria bacterium]